MTYQELLTHLFSISDKKFASFSKSISNSSYEVIGVKNPALRAIIKEHKNDVELLTDDFVLGKYLEVDFIYFGLSLSREKNINSQLKFLKEKIHLAKSWIITDCSSSFLKKTSFDAFYDFFIDMYQRKNIYERRMAYVLALKQYKDERIKEILPLIKTKEEYMKSQKADMSEKSADTVKTKANYIKHLKVYIMKNSYGIVLDGIRELEMAKYIMI